MAIINQYHADTDTTYVYESTSYWDAEKRQSRSKRKLLGKLDPETGEVIPTGPRGRKKKNPDVNLTAGEGTTDLSRQIRELKFQLTQQELRINDLQKENQQLKDVLRKTAVAFEKYADILRPYSE